MKQRADARWRFGDDLAPLHAAIARGAVLAIPTESSYGLAVDPRDPAAVEALLRLKSRDPAKPLPVVGATPEAFHELGVDPAEPALAWGRARWPAALTVVVPIREPIAASLGGKSLAIRVPDHADLRSLLARLGTTWTATSANASGEPPLLDPDAVLAWFERSGADGVVVDGGRLPGGPPSTLVAFEGGRLVVMRPGRVEVA